ncbi:hypothetical protein RUM43_002753 [Polyplax serrata]|uniref:Uncharacterized protein n=1 Tax=Polyplax serrata TaxID=468196 RepID=A0AAN8NZJ8_POLSC
MSCRSGLSSVGANSPRPQSPPSPIAKSTTTTAITAAGGPRPGSPQGRCCDTGRPLFTDPLTGQTVCSCQYDLLSYQRLASAGVGPAGLPALSMYSAPYADGMAAYFPALGADQAPFYTPSFYSPVKLEPPKCSVDKIDRGGGGGGGSANLVYTTISYGHSRAITILHLILAQVQLPEFEYGFTITLLKRVNTGNNGYPGTRARREVKLEFNEKKKEQVGEGSRLKSVSRFLRVGELKIIRGIALNALKKAIKNKRTKAISVRRFSEVDIVVVRVILPGRAGRGLPPDEETRF